MNVDNLALVRRNYVVELPSITPITAMKYRKLGPNALLSCSRLTGNTSNQSGDALDIKLRNRVQKIKYGAGDPKLLA